MVEPGRREAHPGQVADPLPGLGKSLSDNAKAAGYKVVTKKRPWLVVAKISGLNTMLAHADWGADDLRDAVAVAVDAFGQSALISTTPCVTETPSVRLLPI